MSQLKMKVLAAFAPSQDTKDKFFTTAPTSLGWAIALLVHDIDLGIIENVEYVPKIFDPLREDENTWSQYQALLSRELPDVIILSSTYDSHFSAVRMARLAKKHNSEIIVIYGGPHVKEATNLLVVKNMPQIYPFNEAYSPFDFLIDGDGEYILRQLVMDAAKYKNLSDLIKYLESDLGKPKYLELPGKARVHFKKSDLSIEILSTSMQPLNLHKLPSMPRKMFGEKMSLYGFSCFTEINENGEKILLPSTSTMLHRGCKAGCIYCSERGGFNQRSIDSILQELYDLKKQGYKGVFFDDSTLGDHEGFETLLLEMGEVGLKYGSLNRFDKLQDLAYVDSLSKAGFVYQYCSIEQFDNSVLKSNAKGQGVSQIEAGINNLEKAGIDLGVSLLFGLRSETKDSIYKTLEYTAKKVQKRVISCASMSLYTYHPNTPLTLRLPEGKAMHKVLRYDCEPPNLGTPWNNFEEGQWYHPSWVTEEKVQWISDLSNQIISSKLVRNMKKDGSPAL
jgi:radical SAM superfamily enzyme YgiQ (UPF0313 family)